MNCGQHAGVLVDRFGLAAVVTFEALGSVQLELLVQDELTRLGPMA